jgi:hypothetical protein
MKKIIERRLKIFLPTVLKQAWCVLQKNMLLVDKNSSLISMNVLVPVVLLCLYLTASKSKIIKYELIIIFKITLSIPKRV